MDSMALTEMLSIYHKMMPLLLTAYHDSPVSLVVVRKEEAAQSHCDFRVRRSIVLHALQWLAANNIYYRNIYINPDALALLPRR